MPLGDDRVGRPGQPDAVRDVRVPEDLRHSETRANELMLQVHNEGKVNVSAGDRDKMERTTRKLHAAGLWATTQRDT